MTPTEPAPTHWVFPDPPQVDDDMVAVGADLAPGTVLSAYRQGLFPMPLDDQLGMVWWSPVRRAVIPVEGLRITRSLRQSAARFTITVDVAYDEVVAGCSNSSRPGAWIDDRIKSAYRELHQLGWVHSIEVWRGDVLAGGLYGVAVNGLFAGESMFHTARDASKVALMALVDILDDGQQGRLLDVQWLTDHLSSLGAIEMCRTDYLAALRRALNLPLPAIWR